MVAAVQLQRNGTAGLQIQQCGVANPAMRCSNDSSPQSVHFRIENVLLDRLCVRVVRMDDRLNLSSWSGIEWFTFFIRTAKSAFN